MLVVSVVSVAEATILHSIPGFRVIVAWFQAANGVDQLAALLLVVTPSMTVPTYVLDIMSICISENLSMKCSLCK